VDNAAAWETQADAWIAWTDPANTRDGFWSTTWPTMKELLPAPEGLTLDIGCGEGRGARELASLGYRVIGIDRSPTLAQAASARGLATAIGDASCLPIASGSIALAFACMSLLDIDDLSSAVAEIERILRPTGQVVASLVHPSVSMFDPARMREGDLRMPAPYRTHRTVVDRIERDGLAMTFNSIHRPLTDYLGPFLASGFAITGLAEAGDGPVPWCLAFRAERR
jgi:SAM-dependent methyltransferase